MNEKKKIFYTANEVHKIVFEGSLSKTTIHNLIRTGKIPSIAFMTKRLIPAYWVEDCLAKASHKPEGANQ